MKDLADELAALRADAPQTVDYASFPHIYIPPYHYANPVTGKKWRSDK